MSNNVQNRLKFMFAGVLLLLVLYTVIALAVPFGAKFSVGYWVAFGGVYANAIAAVMFILTPLNADGYNNDSCANKMSLISICMVVLGIVVGIIFAAVVVEWWVVMVVVAVELVCALLCAFYFLVTSKSSAEAE